MSEQDTQLPVKREDNRPVAYELTAQSVADHLKKIEDAMRMVMKPDVDYGIIPGCQKPSLLQSGAEKLSTMFRLAPQYTVTKEWLPEARRDWEKTGKYGTKKGTTVGFIRYEVNCQLIHGPTGNPVASGLGVANSFEPKFISRDPYEVEETVLQFARKRAFVNATRTGTAASAIFSQDLEDLPKDMDEEPAKPVFTPTPTQLAQKPLLKSDTPPPFRNEKIGFGKHKEKKWADVEDGYLQWISSQPAKFVSRDGSLTNQDKARYELAYRQQCDANGGEAGVPEQPSPQDNPPPAEELDDNDIPF